MAQRNWISTGQFCSAINCNNNRRKCPEMSFFRFPKDADRAEKWLANCMRDDLRGKNVQYLNNNCVLCAEHFEDSQFMNAKVKNALVRGQAVPTIFKVPHTAKAGYHKRSRHNQSHNQVTPAKKPRTDPHADLIREPEIKLKSDRKSNITVDNLKRKNQTLRMKLHRLKHQISNQVMTKTVKVQGRLKQGATFFDLRKQLSRFLSATQVQFVMSQVTVSMRSTRGRRWTAKGKSLALSSLHSSPKTYRLLRKVFALPPVQTLRGIVAKAEIHPGFTQNIIDALKHKVTGLPAIGELVSLVIDEMVIKEGVSYDSHRDVVEGFAHSTERTHQFANHALVFMVRGLVSKWKLPIGYFLSSGPMQGSTMKKLLIQAIAKLEEAGLTVMVVISDQASNNMDLFEKQLGVSADQPFFFHQQSKVYVMYDPPHLMTSMWNNLKKHGFTLNGNDILWDHIRDFYEEDSPKSVRLAPRLTKRHMEFPPFATLCVHLATQVMSHSVAAGMAAMADWRVIPEDAVHTADFIEQMDQLFNAFNSQTQASTAKMRQAISASSGHVKFLENSLIWIQKIKTKGSGKPDCLNGWQISINTLLSLWEDLHHIHGVKHLFTNRLSQECLENLFSVLRSKGAQHGNPDSREFRTALHQVMIDDVMAPIQNSNSTEDVDAFLANLTGLNASAKDSQQQQPTVSQQDTIMQQLPETMRRVLLVTNFTSVYEEGLCHQKANVIVYIAAYILRRLQSMMCDGCKFKFKSRASNVKFDFPLVPTKTLIAVLEKIELEYRKVVEGVLTSEGALATLVNTIHTNVDLVTIGCDSCQVEKGVVHIMLKIRLHHTLREKNRRLKQSCDRE